MKLVRRELKDGKMKGQEKRLKGMLVKYCVHALSPYTYISPLCTTIMYF